MKYPCETVVRYILPAFRALIAKGLVEDHGFTQLMAAEILGTTQAAVSQYLSSKRGDVFIKKLDEAPQIHSTIQTIIDELAAKTLTSEAVQEKFCELCISLQQNHTLYEVQ